MLINRRTLITGMLRCAAVIPVALIPVAVQAKIDALRHEGLRPDRLTNMEEAIFAERWKGYNSHDLTLRHILNRTPNGLGEVSQRDAEVAASIIQWLGTSCGGHFFWNCENEIRRIKKRDGL